MNLPSETVAILRETWAIVSRDADAVTAMFYDDLFRIAPQLRPLFAHSDLPSQRKKLAAALSLVVRQAHDLGPVIEPLKDMGRRHTGYGVKDADYDSVGAALLTTLERGLGADFTPEVRSAWTTAYGAVAATMKSGAAAVPSDT